MRRSYCSISAALWSRQIYAAPRRPYTKALLATAPIPDPTRPRAHPALRGDIPSPLDPPSGCVFRTPCPAAMAACAEAVPPMEAGGGGHHVACIRHRDLDGMSPDSGNGPIPSPARPG